VLFRLGAIEFAVSQIEPELRQRLV